MIIVMRGTGTCRWTTLVTSSKAKKFKRGSKCSPRELTCSKLQYDPYLISVACSYTDLYSSVRFGR